MDFYQVCSNYAPGAKNGPIVLHRLYMYREKHGQIFLSKTTRPRALIIGMKSHLEDFYQLCSNYAPGAKKWPRPGVTCFTLAYIGEKMKKIFLFKTIWPRALIFGM